MGMGKADIWEGSALDPALLPRSGPVDSTLRQHAPFTAQCSNRQSVILCDGVAYFKMNGMIRPFLEILRHWSQCV